MAVQPGDLLWTIGHELLDAAESVLADGGFDPPGRRFVDFSTSVLAPIELEGHDCMAQLSVNVGPLTPARQTAVVQGGHGKAACALRWSCRFTTTLFRCVDITDVAPTAEEVDERSRDALREGWFLTRGLTKLWAAGDLVPSFEFACEDTQWNAIQTLGPQGGLRAWSIPIDVTVTERYVPV